MMGDKPKRKRSPRRTYLIVGFLLIPVLAVLVLWRWSVGDWKPETPEYLSSTLTSLVYPQGTGITRYTGNEAKAAIEGLVNELPASATNFAYYSSNIQGVQITKRESWMRFDLPQGDFQNWLDKGNRVYKNLTDEQMPFTSPIPVNWWHPETATRYAGASFYGEHESYQMLVDMSQADLWKVYLKIYMSQRRIQ